MPSPAQSKEALAKKEVKNEPAGLFSDPLSSKGDMGVSSPAPSENKATNVVPTRKTSVADKTKALQDKGSDKPVEEQRPRANTGAASKIAALQGALGMYIDVIPSYTVHIFCLLITTRQTQVIRL